MWQALVIGDGYARGYGAWVTLFCQTGPMRRLNALYHSVPNVHAKWAFIER